MAVRDVFELERIHCRGVQLSRPPRSVLRRKLVQHINRLHFFHHCLVDILRRARAQSAQRWWLRSHLPRLAIAPLDDIAAEGPDEGAEPLCDRVFGELG